MAFTQEENKHILEIYELSRKTPRIAVELFKEKFGYLINEATIRKKWKNAGYQLQKRGGLRRGLSKEQFVELYNKHNGDIESMRKETGYKKYSLVKLCLKHELEPLR